MHRSLRAALCAGALLTSACFHQTVQTGRQPGSTVVDKPWVNTFIFGLVEAQPIDVRQQCPSGVATIETEQSFMNGLVAALTFGIYTPQHVRVTCATGTAALPAGAREVRIPAEATSEQAAELLTAAARATLESGAPTVLRF